MEDYLDEMLHLTADIAEELLTIKDTGQPLTDHTAEQIARLAELAVSYRLEGDRIQEDDCAEEASETPLELPCDMPDSDSTPLPDADEIYAEPMAEVEEEMTNALSEQAEEHEAACEVAPAEAFEAEERESMHEADSAVAEEEADAEVELPSTDITVTEETPEECGQAAGHEPVKEPAFTSRDLRNAFTLNDVFLFQRTLFHGSSIEFKSALEEITTFGSVAELKDYLASIHQVDLKSPEAEQFVGIVSTFFR